MRGVPAETLEGVLSRMNRRLSSLGRRAAPRVRTQARSFAAVRTETELPEDAAVGDGFIVVSTGALVVRTASGWSALDPQGVAWTPASYISQGVPVPPPRPE